MNAKGILPWPPVDVLALLPTPDIAGAVISLAKQAELVRSLVDSSFHLTMMPFIEGAAFPALARSGYQTLLPDVEGASVWAEELGLPQAESAVAALFGEVLSLAGELGAMDQNGLGTETRPEEEFAARRNLETAFAKKNEELSQQLDVCDPSLQTDVSDLIEHMRTGDIDFAAEAQAALNGEPTKFAETAGYLTLELIEYELRANKV